MNISKYEQRVLHVLAQGGAIHYERHSNGKIRDINCVTREGYSLADCSLKVFDLLKQRRLIKSTGGRPYRITPLGLRAVNAQHNNR